MPKIVRKKRTLRRKTYKRKTYKRKTTKGNTTNRKTTKRKFNRRFKMKGGKPLGPTDDRHPKAMPRKISPKFRNFGLLQERNNLNNSMEIEDRRNTIGVTYQLGQPWSVRSKGFVGMPRNTWDIVWNEGDGDDKQTSIEVVKQGLVEIHDFLDALSSNVHVVSLSLNIGDTKINYIKPSQNIKGYTAVLMVNDITIMSDDEIAELDPRYKVYMESEIYAEQQKKSNF